MESSVEMRLERSRYFVDRTIRRICLAGSVAAVMLAGTPTFAADAAATDSAATDSEGAPVLQEVVVTGSLLSRPNAETAEAITVISTESLKDQGITTTEQALQQITSNISGDYSTQSSVSTYTGGGSYADLRGLGRSHTLVLLDGQRLAQNVTLGNAVDLSMIPFASIDHIEVLREGASSLYGTDAIAGVINFITKKDYTGGSLNVNFTHPQQDGGGGYNIDGTFGIGKLDSDGYNFMISGSYINQQELTASQRSFASTGFNPARGLDNINGPTGTWPGSYLDANGNDWQTGFPACKGNPHLSTFIGDCEYLYSAAVDLIPKSNTASGLASFSKALPGDNTISIQYFYTRTNVVQWVGPNEYTFTMEPTSPYFPTAANSTFYAGPGGAPPDLATSVQAGFTDPTNNRYFGDVNTQNRVLLSFDGKNGGWDYSTAFNYSVNSTTFQVLGGEPLIGVLAPGGVLSNLINPFGAQSAAGQALINSSYENGDLATGSLKLYDLSGHASHELGDAFGAGRAAAIAVGFDARVESINFDTTPLAVALNATTFYPPQHISASHNSQAVYAEVNVPVTKNFEFTVSDREDRYSDFGDTNNGKVSVRYQPFEFLTFRGAASTGFRAPSLVDLYAPQVFGADAGTMNGPACSAGFNAVFTQLNCASQGLSVTGGNPNLKPETSQNFDLGVIVEPIKDLGVTVDYYRILIKNEILALPDSTIYANPNTFANLYVLNNAGTLTTAPEKTLDCNPSQSAPTCGYIVQTTQNTGSVTTSGIDLSANYLLRTAIGKFKVGLEGTYVTQYLFQEYPNGPQLDLVGWFNNGNQPAIRWQHLLTVDWTEGNWGAGISNHFLSHYIDLLPDAAGNQSYVASYSTWNVYGSWKPIAPVTVVVGMRNAFNTNPPFSNQYFNWQAGYNPLFSDPLGRTFYARLNYKF